jgi:hypothetical protein
MLNSLRWKRRHQTILRSWCNGSISGFYPGGCGFKSYRPYSLARSSAVRAGAL